MAHPVACLHPTATSSCHLSVLLLFCVLRTIRRAAAARLRVLHCLAAVLRRVTFWGVDPGRWCAAVLRTGRVVDPSEESRGVLRTLSVRAFGEGADDK